MGVRNVISIPDWVKSKPKEIAISVEELRACIGTYQYILLAEDDQTIDLISCPHPKDVTFYASYFKIFSANSTPPNKRLFFHGLVYDPKELPYEIEKDQHIFVIYQNWYVQIFDNMNATIIFLNDFIARCNIDDPSDFIVVIGRGYGEGVLASINTSIDELNKTLWSK